MKICLKDFERNIGYRNVIEPHWVMIDKRRRI